MYAVKMFIVTQITHDVTIAVSYHCIKFSKFQLFFVTFVAQMLALITFVTLNALVLSN